QEIEYLYEPESFRPLAQVTHKADQASQLHYIVTDHAGTPQELCSENGEVVWQGEQALWGHYQQQNTLPNHGVRENAHNDELYCDLRYQGQIEDRESGLYYNVNRYYDADSGQYLSPDPIGFSGGLRPQAYVFNPLDWVDPLGLAGDPAKATHITYQGVKGGKPYVGYASKPGFGHGAQEILDYRYGKNYSAFDLKPAPFYKGEGLEGKYTARGLEQRQFEKLGGLDGTSNKQNPVGPNNPRREEYLAKADEHINKPPKACG
ncbi:Rhs family protein, partial [Vibrio vulnificus]|nr:Rhs family protein [Vibrio vulnificus]